MFSLGASVLCKVSISSWLVISCSPSFAIAAIYWDSKDSFSAKEEDNVHKRNMN